MEKYYVNIRVEGGKSEINELLSLLAKIQYLGQIGANDTIPVVVDGDGSGQLKFTTTDTDNNLIDDYKIEEFKKQVQEGNSKIDPHWIGE
jgi:hypothetical protein